MLRHDDLRARAGWRFFFPNGNGSLAADWREPMLDVVLAIMQGKRGRRVKLSRHGVTYVDWTSGREGSGPLTYVKVLDPPNGPRLLARWIPGRRARHIARVSRELDTAGFLTPPVLVYGYEPATGREIVATQRIDGQGFAMRLKVGRDGLVRKRALLRALGAEVARLHKSGFIHGDLTPYNVFVNWGPPIRFIMMDHARTRRTLLVHWERARIRNLVQLGHFELPGMTRTDRMRMIASYAAAFGVASRRAFIRRAFRLLAARMRRDRRRVAPKPAPAPIVIEQRRAQG
jgi:hypothetical protein